jgi:hypothetical protein
MLSSSIKIESDNRKKFLYENSIHSLDEYFELQKKQIYLLKDLN